MCFFFCCCCFANLYLLIDLQPGPDLREGRGADSQGAPEDRIPHNRDFKKIRILKGWKLSQFL